MIENPLKVQEEEVLILDEIEVALNLNTEKDLEILKKNWKNFETKQS